MSKLDNASIVPSKATNFFAKKPLETPNVAQQIAKIANKTEKPKGRPKKATETKDVKLSLSLSATQKGMLANALKNYNNSKKDDIFFKPLSMNEFVITALFSSQTLLELCYVEI